MAQVVISKKMLKVLAPKISPLLVNKQMANEQTAIQCQPD